MLARRIADVPVLLADGATGTNLFGMGLTSGNAPEIWLDKHPDRIQALHRAFVEAGADIILTNSFGANARRLMLHDMQARARELNRIAASLAREVADRAGRPVVVAGSVGPTGELLAPLGPLTERVAVEIFTEQITGLKEGGVDVVWIETMSSVEEMRAAATAAGEIGIPYTLTASFDTAGRTMMGLSPAGLIEFAASLVPKPVAIGSNCGVGAADLVVSVLGMMQAVPTMPLIAKANAGIPVIGASGAVYSGTQEIMARYAELAIDAGARIIGGCCGTTPAHLAAMRRAIDTHCAGPRPEFDVIVAALGALVSPPKADGETQRRASRRRGKEVTT
jgi:5-methyltetrahydrofolate--homocysteine methyltransferase